MPPNLSAGWQNRAIKGEPIMLTGVIIGLVTGVIVGYLACSLMVCGKNDDRIIEQKLANLE
jgi:hypothetical protein